MIQRVQSIFFLLAGLIFAGEFKFPFATSSEPSNGFLEDSIFNILDHPVMIGLTGVGILLSLVAIFLYNNRSLQLRFGYLIIVMAILLPVVSYILFLNYSKGLSTTLTVDDGIGTYLPIGIIIFAVLANRFTKKDENLVRSMDRLR